MRDTRVEEVEHISDSDSENDQEGVVETPSQPTPALVREFAAEQ